MAGVRRVSDGPSCCLFSKLLSWVHAYTDNGTQRDRIQGSGNRHPRLDDMTHRRGFGGEIHGNDRPGPNPPPMLGHCVVVSMMQMTGGHVMMTQYTAAASHLPLPLPLPCPAARRPGPRNGTRRTQPRHWPRAGRYGSRPTRLDGVRYTHNAH
jgi:hypothetical protein